MRPILACFLWLALETSAFAASVTLAWDYAPHTNLSSFHVKYGLASGAWTNSFPVPTNFTTAAVNGLLPGFRYFFIVTAMNVSGLESDPSNEVGHTVPGSGPVPDPVVGLVIVSITNSPSPPSSVNFYLEAEAAFIVAPMVLVDDATARGGRYIRSTSGDIGTATFTFPIDIAANYIVWGRVNTLNGSTDSFYVMIDGSADQAYHAALDPNSVTQYPGTWQWTRVNSPESGNPRVFSLVAGTHTIRFRSREPNTSLDVIYLSTDTTSIVPPP